MKRPQCPNDACLEKNDGVVQEMRCVKNEVLLIDPFIPGNGRWGDYYECPSCGTTLATGFGRSHQMSALELASEIQRDDE